MNRHMRRLARCAILGATVVIVPSAWGADPVQGQKLVRQRCTSCHTAGGGDGDGDMGPSLKGIVGRKVAGASGFAYTPQLRAVDGTWTAQRLEKFLEDPSKFAAGTAMPIRVPSPHDRADIVSYLASLK